MRNATNSRRERYSSSGESRGKSLRQAGCSFGGRPSGATETTSASSSGIGILRVHSVQQEILLDDIANRRLIHGGQHIELFWNIILGHQHSRARGNCLRTKLKGVDRSGVWT